MYRLMKSERYTLNHLVSGQVSSYRQSEVAHYQHAYEALKACEVANNRESARHYVLNDTGKEYYGGTWID
jgi:hypothetical protein